MLDKQDLQAIKELIDTSVNSAIAASEERTQAKFDAMDAKLDAMENRWHAYIEGSIVPQLQLLAKGRQNILNTLAPKDRVDALEEDVVFLKSIVKSLMQEVSDLKKAQ